MGAVTLMGKGSRDRTRDRAKFKRNFDDIKWRHETSATRVVKKPGKTRYVYT